MTAASEPERIAAPPARPRAGFPPDRKWAGRALFFAAGFAALHGAIFALDAPRPRWVVSAVLAAPLLLGAFVVVQRIRHGARWRWASYFTGVVFVPLLLGALLLGSRTVEDARRTTGFEPAAWRQAERADRRWMVDDLLAQQRLVGHPIGEVDALLGSDDGLHGTRFADVEFDGYDRVWYLGPERPSSSKRGEWLILEIGVGGNVIDAHVARH